MRATCSRWGSLCDPTLVGAVTAAIVLSAVVVHQTGEPSPELRQAMWVLCVFPLTVAIGTTLLLLGQRRRVVDWLGGLPFGVDNLNSVFNGLGEAMELEFVGEGPEQALINERLEQVDENCFVMDFEERGKLATVRIGIVDSKWLPTYSNYLRWQRVKLLVHQVLLPLHDRHAIDAVRIV